MAEQEAEEAPVDYQLLEQGQGTAKPWSKGRKVAVVSSLFALAAASVLVAVHLHRWKSVSQGQGGTKSSTSQDQIRGVYLMLADDGWWGRTSTDDWTPQVPSEYSSLNLNTFYLSFINPERMPAVPPAFDNFYNIYHIYAPGGIIFSIGGQSYSKASWSWLGSEEAAVAMAQEVAEWTCDGIDIDIEDIAGDGSSTGSNLLAFAEELRRLQPDWKISLPVYGYPQIDAENYMVNKGIDTLDSIGIMVYDGTESLDYVDNYAGATALDSWPITTDVSASKIVAGLSGADGFSFAVDTVLDYKYTHWPGSQWEWDEAIGGYMFWFGSVLDASTGKTAISYGNGALDLYTAASSAR